MGGGIQGLGPSPTVYNSSRKLPIQVWELACAVESWGVVAVHVVYQEKAPHTSANRRAFPGDDPPRSALRLPPPRLSRLMTSHRGVTPSKATTSNNTNSLKTQHTPRAGHTPCSETHTRSTCAGPSHSGAHTVPLTQTHTQHTPCSHKALPLHVTDSGGHGGAGGQPPVPEPHPPGGRNSRPRPHTSRHQRPAFPQHTNHPSRRRPAAAFTATGPRWVLQTLKQACSWKISRSAICVQRFDDSLSSAIRTTYRISLRSSSLQ